MSKKILTVKSPLINCYNSYGALFSIIPDNMEAWVYNNFIQIRYASGWKMLTFDNHRMLLSNCPGISFYIISKGMFNNNFDNNLKKTIVDSIDSGEYIHMYMDRYYLSSTKEYMKNHFVHEIFIYGYDLENELVYVQDNFKGGKYTSLKCLFVDLENGYKNITGEYEFLTDIRFIQVKHKIKSEINIDQIIDGLERYLYSKKTYDMLYEQECDFGIEIVNRLSKQLKDDSNLTSYLDIRTFHLLFEHKLLMKKRVDYLLKLGYISYEEIDFNNFLELENDFLTLRNMAIKYNMTKKQQTLLRIIETLDLLNQHEKDILNELTNILKSKNSESIGKNLYDNVQRFV